MPTILVGTGLVKFSTAHCPTHWLIICLSFTQNSHLELQVLVKWSIVQFLQWGTGLPFCCQYSVQHYCSKMLATLNLVSILCCTLMINNLVLWQPKKPWITSLCEWALSLTLPLGWVKSKNPCLPQGFSGVGQPSRGGQSQASAGQSGGRAAAESPDSRRRGRLSAQDQAGPPRQPAEGTGQLL